MKTLKSFLMGCCLILGLAGCVRTGGDNGGQMQSYPSPAVEAGWIREGQPIEYEGNLWYPVDDIESMLDNELYQIAEYKGTQIFVDKVDAKPYNRLYTKFAKGKFRYFELKRQ